jgi:Fe-S-cluster containining protein
MHSPAHLASGDRALIQILDSAMAEAARRSGAWLVCRPGCSACCMGPFPITPLDAFRLRAGLVELAAGDPERAARVRQRAGDAAARLSRHFPGHASNDVLDESEEAEERFAKLVGDEPCPALDPASGACDLYAARPVTCRIFGPAVRLTGGEALGVCALCYQGATDEQIAACEVEPDPGGVENALLDDLKETTGKRGQTLVAFALAAPL